MTPFEIQRALDLPAPLPPEERILWMGAPRWWTLAQRVFHLRGLAVYFAIMIASNAAWKLSQGADLAQAMASAALLLPLALAGLGIFALLGWLMAVTTTYAITDRQVLMRIGVALSITVNVPLRDVREASLRAFADGTGDISIAMNGTERVAYFTLWPHVRPWKYNPTQPMLRCVPDAAGVATILAGALAAVSGAEAAALVPRVVPATGLPARFPSVPDRALHA